MTKTNILKAAVNHFKTVCIHKYWVFYYAYKCGIVWRGLKHDLSKFSYTEFSESIKYYTGTGSPIDKCKKINGVSYAWLHHKGRNDHHYEYWQDNFDNGGNPVKMPYKCVLEMLCDYLAAGRAYQKDKFTYKSEFKWFINKISNNIAMDLRTKVFIYTSLEHLACYEKYEDDTMNILDPKRLKIRWQYADTIKTEEEFKLIREEVEKRW